jgi:hypothetical protein
MGTPATGTATPHQHAPARGQDVDHADQVEPLGRGTGTATRAIVRGRGQAAGAPRLTAWPETPGQRFRNSAAVWLALMAYWALADVLLARFPPGPGGRQVAPEGWAALAVYAALGLVGAWCAARTGFPAAWDARLPAARRLLLPALVGAGFGVLAIAVEEATHSLRTLEGLLGPATVAFPASLLVYSAGAIKWELLFLLFPVPALLWLVSGVALRGRGQARTFWGLAALSAAVEPLLQGVPLLVLSGGAIGPAAFAAYAAHGYAFNFAAAVGFRRSGLLAAVLVRLGDYLVWHVLYGNFFFS